MPSSAGWEPPTMPDPSVTLVLGWKERIDFPDWGLRRVKVKIDTGARTSAIGAVYYDVLDLPGEGRVADLVLALDRKTPERQVKLRAPVLGTVVVRNSAGQRELRPIIETRVRLGPLTKVVRFTVTNRTQMRFPIILGRRALAGDCIVDVNSRYLLRKKRRPPDREV
jgi:hypothetical protein